MICNLKSIKKPPLKRTVISAFLSPSGKNIKIKEARKRLVEGERIARKMKLIILIGILSEPDEEVPRREKDNF